MIFPTVPIVVNNFCPVAPVLAAAAHVRGISDMKVTTVAGKVFHHTQSIDEFCGWFPEIDTKLFQNIHSLDEIRIVSGNLVFIYSK
jgi:hypothetical protein